MIRLNTTLLALVLLLNGCALTYKMDIQQGNPVTQAFIEKLKPGMSRQEVQFILGTPIIEDPFHGNRWDYFFSLHKGNAPTETQQRISIFFDGDTLKSVKGKVQSEATAHATAVESDDSGGFFDNSWNFINQSWEKIWK